MPPLTHSHLDFIWIGLRVNRRTYRDVRRTSPCTTSRRFDSVVETTSALSRSMKAESKTCLSSLSFRSRICLRPLKNSRLFFTVENPPLDWGSG